MSALPARDVLSVQLDTVRGATATVIESDIERTVDLACLSRTELPRACKLVGLTYRDVNPGANGWHECSVAAMQGAIEGSLTGGKYEPPQGESGGERAVTTTPAQRKATTIPPSDDAAASLLTALESMIAAGKTAGASVDEEQVRDIVTSAIGNVVPELIASQIKDLAPVQHVTRIEVQGVTVREIEGRTHPVLSDVLDLVRLGRNVLLYGPAGTGKSTIAEHVATALDRPFTTISLTPDTGVHSLMGYRSVTTGEYVPTEFAEGYVSGHVILVDEVDNGTPEVVGGLNMALANGHCAFPDGTRKRHADTVIIAAGNTPGTGPTQAFIGRSALDRATLDRFERLFVGIDETLEDAMVAAVWDDVSARTDWLSTLRQWRHNAESHRIHDLSLSPRRAVGYASLRSIGWRHDKALETAVWGATPADTRRKVMGS